MILYVVLDNGQWTPRGAGRSMPPKTPKNDPLFFTQKKQKKKLLSEKKIRVILTLNFIFPYHDF